MNRFIPLCDDCKVYNCPKQVVYLPEYLQWMCTDYLRVSDL